MKKKLLLKKSICNSDEDDGAGVSGAFNNLKFLKCLSHLKNTVECCRSQSLADLCICQLTLALLFANEGGERGGCF